MDSVEATYDAFADDYDEFTADHRYDALTADLERLAGRHGLRGIRLLDIACGTGKSFEPFVRRGFEVTACDISRRMLERARSRAGPTTRLLHADARELPELGEFDLVICLDDSLNYLLEPDDLERVFRSVARALATGGIFIFDVNTLGAFRTTFSETACSDRPGRFFAWRGEADPQAEPGVTATAVIDIFREDSDGRWSRLASRHVQRHHPDSVVQAGLGAAGLRVLATHGLTPDGTIHDVADELAHAKRIYLVA